MDETKALVQSVLNDVHEEYYEWERSYCSSTIAALTSEEEEVVNGNIVPFVSAESFMDSWSSSEATIKMASAMDQQNVHIYSADRTTNDSEDEVVSSIYSRKVQACCIVQAPPLTPCPAYDYCTASSRSMYVGDDPNSLPFIPFPYDSEGELLDFAEMPQCICLAAAPHRHG